jgi:hypothetical protein
MAVFVSGAARRSHQECHGEARSAADAPARGNGGHGARIGLRRGGPRPDAKRGTGTRHRQGRPRTGRATTTTTTTAGESGKHGVFSSGPQGEGRRERTGAGSAQVPGPAGAPPSVRLGRSRNARRSVPTAAGGCAGAAAARVRRKRAGSAAAARRGRGAARVDPRPRVRGVGREDVCLFRRWARRAAHGGRVSLARRKGPPTISARPLSSRSLVGGESANLRNLLKAKLSFIDAETATF